MEKISCGRGKQVKCGPNSSDVVSSASQRSLFSAGPPSQSGAEAARTTQPVRLRPPEGQNIGLVEGNHPLPHVAAISAAQLSAGHGIILEISNGSHSHTVTLTGAQVMQISAGARVSVESSTNPHSNGADPHAHIVTFN